MPSMATSRHIPPKGLSESYTLQVFRLVSLWFNFYSRNNVVHEMISTVKEVQSYKFIPLVYQIASRLAPICADCFGFSCKENGYRSSIPYYFPGK
ncbi:hypothetical protein ZIOFF_062952 [Zingiber officinale]|uniref:Uncharacterized protein n=1 Tax=Zingiber officinale TaxID=94328 RepID=A0A8J5KB05_ZINOF|nr:hypothetical protein ZIOFF_062952 [Zingiber officinale]